MRVFRLVNSEYDPTKIGEPLSRESDHSNQKLGQGMYFALTEKDACKFAKSPSGYKYTHLLECELPYEKCNFCDLTEDSNAIERWWLIQFHNDFSKLNSTLFREKIKLYCEHHDQVGVIWASSQLAGGWTELVVLKSHIKGIEIINSSKLPAK